jgi:hypothetical protein
MRYLTVALVVACMTGIAIPSGFSQLWNNSEYFRDRINTENTYFILHGTGEAEFGWASEWTNDTVMSNQNRSAMFLWHFKDGTVAYSLQEQYIGDIGKNSGFLLTAKSSNLEDPHRNRIQPLTQDNYPVKVELWIGNVDDSTGFAPEFLGEAVCLDAQSIEPDHQYFFSGCQP